MKRSTKRFSPSCRSSVRRACPHCAAFSRIRTSEAQSAYSRVTKFQCTNIECAFAWAEGSEILYAINTSGCPNPEVNIPTRRKEARS